MVSYNSTASWWDMAEEKERYRQLAQAAATICGGGGGGRPDSASAGGKDSSKVEEALSSVESLLSL